MAQIDGGEMLVRVLETAGIREFFTLHGGHLDAVYQAARNHGFRIIDTRHEQAAGHAADGWARTTGRIGCAMVTAGPGVTDVTTGVANAYLDCVPILVIGGAAPLADEETLPLQGGIDQVALMRPITKWAHRITHPHRIPDLVAQGIRTAVSGRPGPVFLEIPIDVLFASVDESRPFFPRAIRPDTAPSPAAEAVDEAIRRLRDAQRPAILAGGGAWFSGAGEALVAFAERAGIPVFPNSKARGMMPDDHPLAGRSFTTLAVAAQMMQQPPDVVLLVGTRIGLFTGGRQGGVIPADAQVIQVDVSGEEIGRNRNIDLAIVADCRATLRAFDAAASAESWPDRSGWHETIRVVREGHRQMFAEAMNKSEPPIHPYRLARAIADTVEPEAILVADGGETASWLDMVAQVRGGGHWLSHGYLGCLGTGMPFAIAAKLAHPERQVVCIEGDGSVGLNLAEFDTMARHGLAITTVVNNDRQWGMSLHGQELLYGKDRVVATELGPSDYQRVAEGLGCHAELVEHPNDLGAALERAFSSGKPACVNVMTDPSVIAPVTRAMYQMVMGEAPQAEGDKDEKKVMPYYGEGDT